VPRIHFLNTNKLNYNFSILLPCLWSDLLFVDVAKSTGQEEREGWVISLSYFIVCGPALNLLIPYTLSPGLEEER
jgi:hypothetical protein